MESNCKIRILAGISILIIAITMTFLGNYYYASLMIVFWLRGIYELLSNVYTKKCYFLRTITIIFFTTCIWSIISLRNLPNGLILTLLFILTASMSDTAGYFVGKRWGTEKLGSISPGKTILGSLVAIFIPMIVLPHFFYQQFNMAVIIVILLSISSFLGDLIYSYFKRCVNIKDFPLFVNGHGGILDRIDSQSTAGLILYLMTRLEAFSWWFTPPI